MTEIGPLSWMNWQLQAEGKTRLNGFEAVLFTDSMIIGSDVGGDHDPYRFKNAFGGNCMNGLGPGLVLAADLYDGDLPEIEPPPFAPATGSENWIGLNLDEELAALCSLILGVRLRSSGSSREWNSESPNGRPTFIDYREPVLPRGRHRRLAMLPDLPAKQVNLELLERLAAFRALSAKDAIALVRSAHNYSSALWVAESDPELAWLQLVSAVEVAANRWHGAIASPVDSLSEAHPELAESIRTQGGYQLLEEVAGVLQKLMRSRQKFLGFCLEYLPAAPERQPDWFSGLDWTDLADMRKRVDTVYGHRSKRLHEAIPFPSPMTWPGPLPTPTDTNGALGSASGFSSWRERDTPLTLWAFAHLVRGAILNWWESRA